jgi:hypothetical protein
LREKGWSLFFNAKTLNEIKENVEKEGLEVTRSTTKKVTEAI